MQLKKFCLAILIAAPAIFWAQGETAGYRKYFEAGPWFGLANYSGDVAEDRIVFGETKVAYGFAVRYHFVRHFDFRVHIMRGNISGTDQNSSDAVIKARNFSFFSPVTEVGGMIEYNFIDRDRVTGTGVFSNTVSPFLFVGGAMTFINPEVGCKDGCPPNVTFPEPGQKKRRLAFPGGIGVRADLAEQVSMSVEVGMRPTFTDDIDGVSLYGNKKANDWYTFFGGTLSYVFGKGSR